MVELNYHPKLQKMKSILKVWSMRKLTPMGKIILIKSQILSQLTYIFSVLPTPDSSYFKELEQLCYQYIF